MFFVSSISVYTVLMSGWVSNSKYAFDGAVRGTAQMVSYEVSIGLLFLSVCLCCQSLSLPEIVKVQEGVWLAFPLFLIMVMFFVSVLAETNQVPFDLTEGESELVSGFNVLLLLLLSSLLLFNNMTTLCKNNIFTYTQAKIN